MKGIATVGGSFVGRDEAGMRRLVVGDPAPWMKQALCRETDPELFFPPSENHRRQVNEAKSVCRQCPVVHDCAGYAIERPALGGIWGGTTDTERRRIRNAALRSPLR